MIAPNNTEGGTPTAPVAVPKPKKLVLCFDGTGNTFAGNTGDTNIVKLYDKFDRDADDQYHYYQTGIGTYDIDGGSLNKGFLGNFRSNISRTIDAGIATSFDSHVMAGYRFVMRYYDSGDKIYMFGFSRGAYTARFLARMINTVGLLSKGNEEMVPFAYQLYQDYEQGKVREENIEKDKNQPHECDDRCKISEDEANSDYATTDTSPLINRDQQQQDNGYNDPDAEIDSQQWRRNKLAAFSSTFCRREGQELKPGETKQVYSGVKVYFLGIFDCVNSVAVLENKSPTPITVIGTAKYVRHAVAADERRVKFKAALLDQDHRCKRSRGFKEKESRKEVWFPGNHGDVGGGWPAPKMPNEQDTPRTWWKKLTYVLTFQDWKKESPPNPDHKLDPYQMSDIPLAWMIRELEAVGKEDENAAVKFSARKDGFMNNLHDVITEHRKNETKNKEAALEAHMHDTLQIGWGTKIMKVLLWNFMEYLPFFPRLEWDSKTNKWVSKRFPSNLGSFRDIPEGALLHDSLIWRCRNKGSRGYKPGNNADRLQYSTTNDKIDAITFVKETDSEFKGYHNIHKFSASQHVNGVAK